MPGCLFLTHIQYPAALNQEVSSPIALILADFGFQAKVSLLCFKVRDDRYSPVLHKGVNVKLGGNDPTQMLVPATCLARADTLTVAFYRDPLLSL